MICFEVRWSERGRYLSETGRDGGMTRGWFWLAFGPLISMEEIDYVGV